MGIVVNQATGVAIRRSARRRRTTGRRCRCAPSGCADLSSAIVGISGYPGVHPGWAQFRALGAAAFECCAVAEGMLDAYLGRGNEHAVRMGLPRRNAHLHARWVRLTKERDGVDLVVRDDTTRRPIVASTRILCDQLLARDGHVSEDIAPTTGPLLARKTWRTLSRSTG